MEDVFKKTIKNDFFTSVISKTLSFEKYLLDYKSNFKLLWLKQGTINLDLSNNKRSLKEGECIFIDKDEVLSFSSNFDFELYVLVFSEDFFYRDPKDKILLKHSNLYTLIHTNKSIQISASYSNLLKENFDILNQLNNKEKCACKTLLGHNTISQIIILISSLIDVESIAYTGLESFNQEIINDLDILIKENIQRERFVVFYADRLNLTPKVLNKYCMETYQIKIKNYLDLKCLDEIKIALESNSMSLKEISYTFNFSDLSSFVRFFKRMTNITPSQYKEDVIRGIIDKKMV